MRWELSMLRDVKPYFRLIWTVWSAAPELRVMSLGARLVLACLTSGEDKSKIAGRTAIALLEALS
jgi:hypothetical protein